jgi:WD40 repeat protein
MLLILDPTSTRVAHGNPQGVLSVQQRSPSQVLWQRRQAAAITAVAWSWDGAYLASGDAQGMISLWEAQTGALLASSQGHRGAVTQLQWAPTTYQLTSSAKHEAWLRIWDYAPLLRARQAKAGVGKEAGPR